MSLRSIIAKPYAGAVTRAVMKRAMDPVNTQAAVLRELMRFGGDTSFGLEHRLHAVRDHAELVNFQRMTLMESFACVKLQLWDEDKRRLLSYAQAKAAYGPM